MTVPLSAFVGCEVQDMSPCQTRHNNNVLTAIIRNAPFFLREQSPHPGCVAARVADD